MSEKDKELTEERMAELESTVRATTQITLTPDGEEHGFPEGTVWLYSQGMWDNHEMPDIEMRGVPTSFQTAAGNVINEMNAYRLFHKDNNPFMPGQTVQWRTGMFVIHESEDWGGMYSWSADQMLRLLPREVEINCVCCEAQDAGIEP